MTEQAAPKTTNTLKRMLPGLVISLAALAVLFSLIDLEEVGDSLRLADFRLLPLAVLGFLGTVFARSLAWRMILREQISVSKAFFTENEGYLLNNLLPFRLGEVGRAFLLSQTTKLSFWEVLSTIMVERIFDVGIMAGLLLTTVPFVIGAEWALTSAAVAAALVAAGFLTLFLAARNRTWTMGLFERLTAPWPRLTDFGRDKLAAFLTGLETVQQPKRFFQVLGLMLLTWALNVAWYTVLMRAFIPDIRLLWVVFSVAVVSLGVAAPSTPAYIGVFEAAQVAALALFGIPKSLAFAYAVASHTLYFIITVTLGAVGLARDGIGLGEVWGKIRERKTN